VIEGIFDMHVDQCAKDAKLHVLRLHTSARSVDIQRILKKKCCPSTNLNDGSIDVDNSGLMDKSQNE
jgi:hypothetical protein